MPRFLAVAQPLTRVFIQMKRTILVLASLGLLAVSVLATATLPPLKVDARLDTPCHKIITSRESRISVVGYSSIDTTFDAFAPAALSTPVTWATWTATVARVATSIATYTAGAEPFSPLLDRFVRNKPSIWGNKGFYILLGLIYVTLLGLFLKQVISISGAGREQH
jgi:hypothetical protein